MLIWVSKRYAISTDFWLLYRRVPITQEFLSTPDPQGKTGILIPVFEPLCNVCRRVCLGCDKHWFCGFHTQCVGEHSKVPFFGKEN